MACWVCLCGFGFAGREPAAFAAGGCGDFGAFFCIVEARGRGEMGVVVAGGRGGGGSLGWGAE